LPPQKNLERGYTVTDYRIGIILIAILGLSQRFRQPLDLLPIDAGHVRMDVRNFRWFLRQKLLQSVLAGLQFAHAIGHATRVAAFFNHSEHLL